ncbi:hypothetical protein KHP62_16690 [Rhodobacteraceae bacterium NNCM2]|nr:hypothetical protein [Coraliihabitans acroporae]
MTSSKDAATERNRGHAPSEVDQFELAAVLGETGLTCALDIETLVDRLTSQGANQ